MSSGPALVFRLATKPFAVDAAEVAAVARLPRLSRVPRAPDALAGVGAFNGRAMPVIDLARLVEGVEGGGTRALVLRGADPAAVVVDFVEGVRERSHVDCEWLDLRATLASMFRPEARKAPRAVAGIAPPGAAANERRAGREANFLAFQIAGQRFAFPMAQVRAVLREPEDLTPIPGADPVVLGLTPYRGGVLPVVELARLLGLPAPMGGPTRVLVVEIAGAQVGLRVERALGAFRAPERAVTPAPAALNRGAGEATVSAVAITPSGLVAILAAQRVFDEETMRRLQALAAPAREQAAVRPEAREPFVVIRVGEDLYAAPAACVEAVAPPGRLSGAPNAPSFVAGVMSHRGAGLAVIDARLRLGAAPAARGVVVVIRRDAGAVGLWVDAVERLVHLPPGARVPAPALAGDAGALLAAVAAQDVEGRPLLILDPEALLAQAQRDMGAPSRRERA